ncbi:PRA1 pH-regulated antigen PRA1 [Candida maltosa Xu316]
MKFSILALLSIAVAAPVTVTRIVDASPTGYDWQSNWVKSFPIDNSCNSTQFNQLSSGLNEAQLLADHAREHTLRYGYKSPFYRNSTAEVAGVFDNVVNADKSNILFTCDDLDNKCSQDGWAGYWRGDNHSDETVICDLSFTSRRYLSQLCSNGYTVSQSDTNVYWASDLLHRFFHLQTIGQGIVGHYSDSYNSSLEYAFHNASYAVKNSDSLIYYALDVYAYDIAVPGQGCTGDNVVFDVEDFETTELEEHGHEHNDDEEHDHDEEEHDHDHDEEEHDHDHDDEEEHDHSEGASATSNAGETASTTAASSHCHTHADGEVHC